MTEDKRELSINALQFIIRMDGNIMFRFVVDE